MRPSSDHRSAVDSIRDYYNPLVIHAEVASREYAQLALKSVITLNTGVAVAYPAIAELFLENITVQEFMGPVATAVCGAVLGVICAYLVYFNHSFEALTNYTQMELEIVKADEHFDEETYYQFQKHRNHSKEHWSSWHRKYDGRRDILFYVSNVVGVASLACFSISVVWFAYAVGS